MKVFDWANNKSGNIVLHIMSIRRTKDFQQARSKFLLFLKLHMTPLDLLIIVFPKFSPLTVTGMALYLNLLPESQNGFSLY
jgi:hypothetical protein